MSVPSAGDLACGSRIQELLEPSLYIDKMCLPQGLPGTHGEEMGGGRESACHPCLPFPPSPVHTGGTTHQQVSVEPGCAVAPVSGRGFWQTCQQRTPYQTAGECKGGDEASQLEGEFAIVLLLNFFPSVRVIPELGKLRQENEKLEASLTHTAVQTVCAIL